MPFREGDRKLLIRRMLRRCTRQEWPRPRRRFVIGSRNSVSMDSLSGLAGPTLARSRAASPAAGARSSRVDSVRIDRQTEQAWTVGIPERSRRHVLANPRSVEDVVECWKPPEHRQEGADFEPADAIEPGVDGPRQQAERIVMVAETRRRVGPVVQPLGIGEGREGLQPRDGGPALLGVPLEERPDGRASAA